MAEGLDQIDLSEALCAACPLTEEGRRAIEQIKQADKALADMEITHTPILESRRPILEEKNKACDSVVETLGRLKEEANEISLALRGAEKKRGDLSKKIQEALATVSAMSKHQSRL